MGTFFQGRQRYTEVTTINMYLLIKIRHNIIIQCHGNYIKVAKKIAIKNNMLEQC